MARMPKRAFKDPGWVEAGGQSPWISRLMLLLTLAIAVGSAVPLWRLTAAGERLPQWDMAKYGLDGVRLAQSLRQFDLASFLVHLNGMDVWPPLYPLMQLPAMLVLGEGFSTPRLLSGLLFVLTCWAAFWAGGQLDRERGWLLGAIAAALVVSSPWYHLFGSLIMLEMPGALLTLLALGWYAREQRTGASTDLRLACLFATLLFFCKYNYGLIWLLTLAVNEAWSRAGSPRDAWLRLLRAIASVEWGRPWAWFLIAYGAFLAAVLLFGGFSFELEGFTLRVTTLGNPVYLLLLLLLGRGLWKMRRERIRLLTWLDSLGPRQRIFSVWVAAPILLWMLVPRHTKNFFAFVVNRSSDLPLLSLESLRFYPEAWARDFAPTPTLGWLLMLAGFASLVGLRRLSPPRRVLALAVGINALALLLHPYKLPRFLFTGAPVLWLAATALAIDLLRPLPARLPPRWGEAILVAAGAALLLAAGLSGVDEARLQREVEERTVPEEVGPLLDRVVDLAAASEGSTLVGYWNELSPALVEWRSRLRRPGFEGSRLPLDPLRGARSLEAKAILDRVAASAHGELVMALGTASPPPVWGDRFRLETAPLAALQGQLRGDPRYVRESVRVFRRSGYVLQVFRRRSSGEGLSE